MRYEILKYQSYIKFYFVGILQYLTHSYLCTSVDGLVQMNIDGVLQNVPLEFKTFSAYISWEASLQIANEIGKYNRCTFGDNLFKNAVDNMGYRVQVLHHALVMKTEYVLYIAAGRNEIAFMTLVSFPEDVIKNYFGT